MEAELFNTVASGGSVAVLAMIIFLMYRKDKQQEIERWRSMAESCMACRAEASEVIRHDADSREKMTEVLSHLATLVKVLSGQHREATSG